MTVSEPLRFKTLNDLRFAIHNLMNKLGKSVALHINCSRNDLKLYKKVFYLPVLILFQHI